MRLLWRPFSDRPWRHCHLITVEGKLALAVLERKRFFAVSAVNPDGRSILGRRNFDACYRIFGQAFKPYRLPDSADRRVPHSAAVFLLLAPRILVVKVIVCHHRDLIFTFGDCIGYIKREGEIATLVCTDPCAVYINTANLVNRTEIENYTPPVKALGQAECTPVTKRLAKHLHFQSGCQALGAKRHSYPKGIILFVANSEIPTPVKANITVPLELRAGIIVMRTLRRHAF